MRGPRHRSMLAFNPEFIKGRFSIALMVMQLTVSFDCATNGLMDI